MKVFVFVAAFAVASAATAQSGNTVSDPSQSNGPRGVTQQGTDPDGMGTAPPGANQPVQAPAGAQVVVNPDQASVFATRPATAEYPACSKNVTDGCVQAYEKGVRRPRG